MPGLGTLANVLAIIFGGIIGVLFGKKIPGRVQETIQTGNAVAVLFIGIGGTLQHMLVLKDGTFSAAGTMMMIFSMAIGGVIGEWMNIDRRMKQFGVWLKEKTGNAKDTQFVDGFVVSSLTVCIGAMAIVGSIQDGIHGDHSVLFAKAILDMIIVMVFATTKGKGCIFSAIPVGILQGSVTLLARLISPYITDTAMSNLSYVGSILIFCVGLNLLFDRKIRVANMLPALIVAAVWR
ncbi:DUF554 domain-containing protein [Chordicoccus furentiruminis]|uniref:DUF554 domain-containing protein n=1 Tax=Chordicoccus furentiruminis TaxID=2709410 RepID=UPI0023A8E46B|nr:DUF554 domain-containing protein [Chordicoccus furentiruminis]